MWLNDSTVDMSTLVVGVNDSTVDMSTLVVGE